jgi:uncharacterized membrane protein YvbJ
MNVHKLALACAVLALASPVAVLADTAPQTAPATTLSSVLNTLTSSDRAQVQSILALLHSNQMNKESAATQIDSFLTDDESKAVLALSKDSTQTDAGEYIVTLAQQ